MKVENVLPQPPTIFDLPEAGQAEARAEYERALVMLKNGGDLTDLPDRVLIGYVLFLEAAFYFAALELNRRRHLQPAVN